MWTLIGLNRAAILIAAALLLSQALLCVAEEGGRYPTPEQSPAFRTPTFINSPITKAYPGTEYNMRPAVTGGTWPYAFTLTVAPDGMSIDERSGTIIWQAPQAEQQAQVAVTVTDRAGRKAEQVFALRVTRSNFYFVSPDGDDANPGTIDKPWQTVMRAAQPVDQPSDATVYLREGTYAVISEASPGKNNANVLGIMRTSPRHWVAWPGESPAIDLGWSDEKWKAAYAAEQAEVTAGKKSYASTQGYGHRIFIDQQVDDLLFDGLEVKNAAYYMFVMWEGNRERLTWRRCKLHHLWADWRENGSFIFGFSPDRKFEPAGPGESFPFGKRPVAKPYRNMVIQECTISDVLGEAGAGLHWYVTQGSLIEDSRFERTRGHTLMDKDNGWDNTYRNNVFVGDVMFAAQGCNDGINFHHNFVDGNLHVGGQPGWVRNIWVHHNAVRGRVMLMAGATQGPTAFDPGDKALDGPADPDSQLLIREFPLDERLVFVWGNVVAVPEAKAGSERPFLSRVSGGPGFAEKHRFVYWNHNLVDPAVEVVIGWSGKRMRWSELAGCGFDVNGASDSVVLDAEGRLPHDSPWRATFGRDAVADMKP